MPFFFLFLTPFSQFVTDVMKPLQMEGIIDQEVQYLSGGMLGRVGKFCHQKFNMIMVFL